MADISVNLFDDGDALVIEITNGKKRLKLFSPHLTYLKSFGPNIHSEMEDGDVVPGDVTRTKQGAKTLEELARWIYGG